VPTDSFNNKYPASGSLMESQNWRSRNWTNTLNYSSRVSNDDLPINSYTDYRLIGSGNIAKSTRTPKSGGATVTTLRGWDKNDTTYGGFMYLASAEPHRSDASLQNETVLKALVKVADAKTNLAVMFAEKAKVSNLILETANRVYRAMLAFRRGRLKEVARILNINPKNVHKTWLEYKYGWMPLLMDVKNSAEFFAQQHVGRPIRFSVSSRTDNPVDFWETKPGFNRMGFQSNLETISYSTVQLKRCRVKIWCEISNPHLSQLQQLGVTNPALVVWELVPYSFVFDWFISVGDWLQGLTALHGVTVRKAMISFVEGVEGGSVETFPGYNGVFDVYGAWSITRSVDIRRYRRSPLTVDPSSLYPPVDFSLPSWQKMVTGLALLRSNSRNFGLMRV
jgi:hypothetical protein